MERPTVRIATRRGGGSGIPARGSTFSRSPPCTSIRARASLRTLRSKSLAFLLLACSLTPFLSGCDNPVKPEPTWPPKYDVIDLGTLGGSVSLAFAINENGVVTGYAQVPSGRLRAVLWRNGATVLLKSLAGVGSDASAIDRWGDVVGWSYTADGPSHAALWHDGSIRDLGTLPGDHASGAYDINDERVVVGYSYFAYPEQPAHTVIWNGGKMTDLGPDIRLGALNNSGTAVGCMNGRAVVWRDGVVTDLAIPVDSANGGSSCGVDINDDGVVLVNTSAILSIRTFIWDRGTVSELRYPGAEYTSGAAISATGQVVGSATVGERLIAFAWQNGRWLNLDSIAQEVLGTYPVYWTEAFAVNSRGQIVGGRMTPEGWWRATLWKPR